MAAKAVGQLAACAAGRWWATRTSRPTRAMRASKRPCRRRRSARANPHASANLARKWARSFCRGQQMARTSRMSPEAE
eukprot:5509974-Pyramimonas_sp.AAC.1